MSDAKNTIFISRAGADSALAIRIAAILKAAGYSTILQDEDFGHASFMARMHDALASGARVAALLSPEYLASAYCEAEWQSALAGDPQNKQQRLIVFRVKDCAPAGLLKPIPYVNLVPVCNDTPGLTANVLNAVGRGSASPDHRPGTLIDPDANWDVPSFTGRGDELDELQKALFAEGGAAVTQPAAVHGMGGIGKSALAREYARRNRTEYSILWWLNAETEDGIVGSLIRLGARFIPGLDQEQDRARAAKLTLERVFAPLNKPALLVFDNIEDQALLRKWKPPENCHVLVTSRLHGWGGGFKPIEIRQLPPDDARAYLLRESARADISSEDAGAIAKALGYLPLALAHAAATLRDSPAMTAQSYLARIEMLMDRAPHGAEYDKAVYATFQEALQKAEQRAPGAAAILCLAAFYAPDDIPLELFEHAPEMYSGDLAPHFDDGSAGASLGAALSSPNTREDAFSALALLSLVTLDNKARNFSVHRLLQAACRDLLAPASEQWLGVAVRAMLMAWPGGEFGSWPLCERLVVHAENVATLAADSLGSPLAELLGHLDNYLDARANFARAERASRRALLIDEAVLGPSHPKVALRLNNLAVLLRNTNRLSEAEPLIRRALAIDEVSNGPDHPKVATRLNNLAVLLRSTNRLSEAEPLMRRALAIGEASYGPHHPDVAIRLSNLAGLLQDTNRLSEAEPLMRRALAIDEASYGPDHPRVAIQLNNLAQLLLETNRLSEAEPLMRRALAIDEASNGPYHPTVATRLNNLAQLLVDTHRLSEAEPLMRRALAIDEASRGPGHPAVATGLNNLAGLLKRTNRFSEAEPLMRRALAIDEASYGADHPEVAIDLNNLAGLLQSTGHLSEAAPLYERALKIFRTSLGDEHPHTKLAAGGASFARAELDRQNS